MKTADLSFVILIKNSAQYIESTGAVMPQDLRGVTPLPGAIANDKPPTLREENFRFSVILEIIL